MLDVPSQKNQGVNQTSPQHLFFFLSLLPKNESEHQMTWKERLDELLDRSKKNMVDMVNVINNKVNLIRNFSVKWFFWCNVVSIS